MCALTAAVGILGTVASGIGSIFQINQRNKEAAANRRNAQLAANDRGVTSDYNYIQKMRQTQSQGFDRTLKGRAQRGQLRANQGTIGTSGNSVDETLAEAYGYEGRDLSRIRDQKEGHRMNWRSDAMTNHAQVRQAWSDNQPQSYVPTLISTAGGVLSAGLKGFNHNNRMTT